MNLFRQTYFYLRIIADILILIISFKLTFFIIPTSVVFRSDQNLYLSLVIILLSWLISSNRNGIYDEFRSRNFSYELIAILKNTLVLVISIVASVILFKEGEFPKRFVVLFPLISFVFLVLEKYLFRKILYAIRIRGRNLRSILIIGAGESGRQFHDEIKTNPHFGYHLIGFLDDEIKDDLNGSYLGPIKELRNLLETHEVDNVMITLHNSEFNKINEIIRICEQYPIRIRMIPDYFHAATNKYSVSMFGDLPVISLRENKINDLPSRLLKRGFDTLISIFLFTVVLSWLLPLIAVLIKLDSKGPVFFKQERWGRGNKRFYIYKFRTMILSSSDLDSSGKYNQASKNDPRITRIGKFLRKTNFDELPQFLNVISGQISMVGPRPHPTPLNIESKDEVDFYMRRHLVKPGITGWAQVHGLRGETRTKEMMKRRVEYDLWYIENWSFFLDLQILFLTLWRMIKGDPNAY